jgi:hypothetical protein
VAEVVQLKRLAGSSSAVGGRGWLVVSDEVFLGSGDEIEGVAFDSSRLPSTMSLAAGSYDDTVASE